MKQLYWAHIAGDHPVTQPETVDGWGRGQMCRKADAHRWQQLILATLNHEGA